MNKKIFNSSGKGRSSVILLFTFLIISLGAINCSKDSSPGGNNIPAASTVEALTFSPVAGTYNTDQSVTIATATEGATIYYTTDGSAPTSSSTEYTAAISVAGYGTTMTIKAIAAKSGVTDSDVTEATYTIDYNATAMPTFSPAAGTYNADQSVTISTATEGALIYYTTDGSTPTNSSAEYTAAISVAGHGATMTIRAIAVKSSIPDSDVAEALYTINYDAVAMPTFSPPAGRVSSGTIITILSTTAGASFYYTTDGSTPACSGIGTPGPSVTVSSDMTIQAVACLSGMTDSSLASSAYTVEHWVAVGLSGTVIYSSDGGNNWFAGTSGTTQELRSVAYDGSSRFVAVGGGGTVIYSDDGGVSWNAANDSTAVTTQTLRSVAYNGSRWVAVGGSGIVIYSLDNGVNWSTATGLGTVTLYGIVNDSTRFIAVGDNTEGSGKLIYSTSGNSWTALTNDSGKTASLWGVASYGLTKFVAVGMSGTVIYSNNGGTNWIAATDSSTTTNLTGIAYDGSSRLVAVGLFGTVIYSDDGGASWLDGTGVTGSLSGVAHDGVGRFVAVGGSGIVYLSDDGASWSPANDSGEETTNYLRGVSFEQ